MQPRIILSPGVLHDCYHNVKHNILHNISPDVHAQTYVGAHDMYYAEPEFTGKYLDICMQYLKRGEAPEQMRAAAKQVTESILQNQKPNGDVACLANGGWFSVWNQTFTVLGLLSCYRVLGEEGLLQAAMKCADGVIAQYQNDLPAILDTVNDGSQHIPFLLPLAMLYDLTREARYGAFLDRLLAYLETTDLNLLSFEDILKLRSRKGIEMLVIYLGVLYYGKVTGRRECIEAAARYFDQVDRTQIRNTGNGTLVEFWTEGGNAPRSIAIEEKPNETCVAVGFCELALMLFWETGEARYLDAVERSLFNHMLGSIDPTGTDFGYYQGNFGTKVFKTAGGLYQCCRYRGYCFFSHLPDMLYHYSESTLTPCIYAPSSFEAEGLSLIQTGSYPAAGDLTFTLQTQAPLRLRLRIPAWCSAFRLRVNGRVQYQKAESGFLSLPLAAGDHTVELLLQMDTVTEYGEIDGERYAAFTHGPLLLAADSSLAADGTPYRCGAFRQLPATAPHLLQMQSGELILTDYATAGREHPGEDLFRVWIPVAGRQRKLVCVGDSLTEGDYGEIRGVGCVYPENYPFFLSRMTGAVTVNYGKCGYTTAQILEMYTKGSITWQDADLVIFMLGTNQGLTLNGDLHLESYRTLLQHAIRDCGKHRLLLCTPPHATEIEGKVNYGYNGNVINAGEGVRRLAKELGLPVADLYSDPRLGAAHEEENQPNDGLHFAAFGYRCLAKVILEHLQAHFPSVL